MANLADKNILLGVTGGIAAYKAVELLRLFTKAGAKVTVVLTKHAAQFIPPLTFETLSKNKVITDLFASEPLAHLTIAEKADLLVIAPATANILAKLYHGVADDALTTLALAYQGPMVLAPAMNEKMYLHPATQENLDGLQRRPDVYIVSPESGLLACAEEGIGRLANIDKIFQRSEEVLTSGKRLAGVKILITAGPTQEPLDPVRFLSNRSSGKMGYALTRSAANSGAQVTLISGPTNLVPPPGARLLRVTTAEEMLSAVKENFSSCDVLIMSAAVADYRPLNPAHNKIKKESEKLTLPLVKNPDILTEVGKIKSEQIMVGFALETDQVIARALDKLKAKNLDMIIANSASALSSDESAVTIIDRKERLAEMPLQAKRKTAGLILDRISKLLEERRNGKTKTTRRN